MNRSHPPTLANWLLREVGPLSADEALVGDLFEEFDRRGSAVWFWRQTAAAIFVGAWRDVVRHWLLVGTAIVVGWSVLTLPIALWFLSVWLRRRGLVGDGWILNLGGSAQLVAAGLSGWVVGRLFAELRAATVLALAASIVGLGVVGVEELARSSGLDWATMARYIGAFVWVVLLCTTGVVIGGFVGRRGPGVIGPSAELAFRHRVDRVMQVLRPMRDL